jgi:putrescine transport system ATP-binding protein
VETPECKHYVGHGITGTLGMDVSVAVRPEKITVSRTRPKGEFNFCAAEVVDLAYLGSYTTYHLKLDSGMKLKASAPNVERHHEGAPTWGDKVYAHWSQSAMVVLIN